MTVPEMQSPTATSVPVLDIVIGTVHTLLDAEVRFPTAEVGLL